MTIYANGVAVRTITDADVRYNLLGAIAALVCDLLDAGIEVTVR